MTLSGGGATRILAIHSSFERDTPALTVQRLTFQGGVRSGSGEGTENGGGAIYRLGGTLAIIDCTFSGNQCPGEGQDVAGGAVYSIGRGLTAVEGSRFFDNSGSNGGALGNLHNDLVIANSIFAGNAATGSGGNPGNGGNGGAIYIDGVGQTVEICGATISGSAANAYGGGLFRVSNDGTGTMTMDTCTIDGNKIPDRSPSMAGGLYLQGMAVTMTATTISNNEARGAGGMFVGPDSTAQLFNVTVAHNTALSSLGGGISFDAGVTGTVLNCTLANNRAPGEVAFAAATVGGGAVTMQNTIVDGHEAGNGWNPISCRDLLMEGGGNIQYPVERAGGGSDDPDALCTPDILVADAMLGPLRDNGGPTLTLMPDPGGPAPGLATGCPATDQRGEPRGEPCTSGAVEVE
ncbi:MAG: right-handed parallel beta-helix repeat-containing protein [Pseudomonadota bacterium]